jgi:hypothetical protein
MLIGGLLCFAGLAVTVLTLAASQVTGITVVSWGAIVFGAIQFVRGLLQARRQQRQADQERTRAAEPGATAERPPD